MLEEKKASSPNGQLLKSTKISQTKGLSSRRLCLLGTVGDSPVWNSHLRPQSFSHRHYEKQIQHNAAQNKQNKKQSGLKLHHLSVL